MPADGQIINTPTGQKMYDSDKGGYVPYGPQKPSQQTQTQPGPTLGDRRLEPAGGGYLAVQIWDGDSWVTTEYIDDRTPKPATGGSGSAQSYSSTAQSQSQAEAAAAALAAANNAAQAERDRLQRESDIEQERIRQAEAKRQNLLSTATTLLEGRRTSRDAAVGRASENAGKDVFRFLANIKGQAVPEGTLTPMDIFKQQNAQIAGFQDPTITPNSTIGDLESAIAKMQTQQQQGQVTTGPFTGFAMGGQIGPGGTQFGTNKTAVLVGDRSINGDEEVLIHDRSTGVAEVIPLSGHAADGATLTPNLTVLPQLFQTLRQDVGAFGGGPRYPSGYVSPSSQGYLSPNQISGPATFGSRGALATPLSLQKGLSDFLDPGTGLPKYTPEEAQQLSNLIGTLPAPHKAGAFLNNLIPSEQAALRSAYELAGFPADDLDAIFNESFIRGQTPTGVSLR
jgi:hypothetical protein